jgi:hypothetical protein
LLNVMFRAAVGPADVPRMFVPSIVSSTLVSVPDVNALVSVGPEAVLTIAEQADDQVSAQFVRIVRIALIPDRLLAVPGQFHQAQCVGAEPECPVVIFLDGDDAGRDGAAGLIGRPVLPEAPRRRVVQAERVVGADP